MSIRTNYGKNEPVSKVIRRVPISNETFEDINSHPHGRETTVHRPAQLSSARSMRGLHRIYSE